MIFPSSLKVLVGILHLMLLGLKEVGFVAIAALVGSVLFVGLATHDPLAIAFAVPLVLTIELFFVSVSVLLGFLISIRKTRLLALYWQASSTQEIAEVNRANWNNVWPFRRSG